jgi:ABC-type transport system involved in cytochrome c biogenesis permease subunit
VGALALTAILLGPGLAMRASGRGWGMLLAAHVFTITLGYSTTLVLGGLGLCFVCQRFLKGFSAQRSEPLRRATFNLGIVAITLTSAGVVLGAIWAKDHMGRYWAWDVKETGGALVLAWLSIFLLAHAWRKLTARGIFLLGILGNIVVTLAWFGTNSVAAGGRIELYSILAGVILLHLLIFSAGLAPAERLRLKKA